MAGERPGAELEGPGIVPAVERARAVTRAVLAPDPVELARTMGRLMEASSQAQRSARLSQRKARNEFYRRLREARQVRPSGVKPEEAARLEAERPSTGELVRLIEAEANLIKDEAMAQRSYKLATLTGPGDPAAGSGYEAFILANAVAGDGGAA